MRSPGFRTTVALFLVADFLYWASLYLYMPTLPGVIEARTGSLAAVGIVVSMFGLWQAFARIPVGVAVDATGRSRLAMIGGFALSAAGALVLAFGATTPVLAAGRALTGLAAATWVPMVAVFGSLFPPERLVAATSLLAMVAAAGRLLGAFAGGFAHDAAGAAMPFVLAAVSALLAVAALAAIRLPDATPKPAAMARSVELARKREVLVPTVAQTFATFASWAVTMTFLPVLASRLGATGTARGLLMSIPIGTSLIGSALTAAAERRLGTVALVRATFVVYCGGITASALSPALLPLFAAAAVTGLANGVYYPMLMSLAVRDVAAGERATATGIHQAVYAIGMFAGPWIGGLLAERLGIRPMFALVAAITLAATWLLAGRLAPPRAAAAARDPRSPG